jgi:hypothetical protein
MLESSGAHKAGEALRSTCIRVWLLGAMEAAAGMGDPSLQAVRALRLGCWCWDTWSQGKCCRNGETKPLGNRSSGACLPGMRSRRISYIGFRECSSVVLMPAGEKIKPGCSGSSGV